MGLGPSERRRVMGGRTVKAPLVFGLVYANEELKAAAKQQTGG